VTETAVYTSSNKDFGIEVIGASSKQSMPEILYIMGTGRTGTTILEILLASNPGITGVGELKHIFRDGFLDNRLCACGKGTRDCDFWSRVLESTKWNLDNCADNRLVVETLESHGKFPLLWIGLASKRIVSRYKQIAEILFKAIGGFSGGSVIVDSSKYASRAMLLAELFPDKVRVLCITRSAAGILRAFQKKNEEEQRPKGLLAVVAYYVYVLMCMRLVRARLKERCLSIRFEDLNRDPQTVLQNIEKWSGIPLALARTMIASAGWMEVGHIVTGNRLRKEGKVQFRPAITAAPVRGNVGERLITNVLESYRKILGF